MAIHALLLEHLCLYMVRDRLACVAVLVPILVPLHVLLLYHVHVLLVYPIKTGVSCPLHKQTWQRRWSLWS